MVARIEFIERNEGRHLPRKSPESPESFNHVSEKSSSQLLSEMLRHSLDGIKVLIVEDSPESAALLSLILTYAGASVAQADSTNAAWGSVIAERPDIIVSDIAMPDEDGITFIKMLRNQEARSEAGSIPAIAVTALTEKSVRNLVLVSGFQECLPKPISAIGLVYAILSLVSPSSSQIH